MRHRNDHHAKTDLRNTGILIKTCWLHPQIKIVRYSWQPLYSILHFEFCILNSWCAPRLRASAVKVRLTRTAEKQDIAVGVLELESAQAVIGVFERFEKLDIARRKFCRQ